MIKTTLLYSKWGFKKTLEMVIRDSLSNIYSRFYNEPIVLLPLVKNVLI